MSPIVRTATGVSPDSLVFTPNEAHKNPKLWPKCGRCGKAIKAGLGKDGRRVRLTGRRDRYMVYIPGTGSQGRWEGSFRVGLERVGNATKFRFGPYSSRMHLKCWYEEFGRDE